MTYCCEVAAQGGVCTCLEEKLDDLLAAGAWPSAEPEARKAFLKTADEMAAGYDQLQLATAWGWWYDGWLSKMLLR